MLNELNSWLASGKQQLRCRKTKNNGKISLFIVLCFQLLVTSCNKQVLRTTVLNAPYVSNLDNKYNIQATVHTSFNHLELQSAYALTNHIGVHTQFYLGNNGNHIIGGPVFFTNIKKLLYLESSFSYGVMHCNFKKENRNPIISSDADSWSVDTKASTFSEQLFAGIKRKNFCLGVGYKITNISFSKYDYTYADAEYHSSGTYNTNYIETVITQKPKGWIFEPFTYLSLNLGRIGLFIEYGKANDDDIKITTRTDMNGNSSSTSLYSTQSLIIRKEYLNAGIILKLDPSKRESFRHFFKNNY